MKNSLFISQNVPNTLVKKYNVYPLAELSQCILDSSNGSIINVI